MDNGREFAAKALTGGSVRFAQTDEQIEITVAQADRHEIDTIGALGDATVTDLVETAMLPAPS